jgi:hypothetical protein
MTMAIVAIVAIMPMAIVVVVPTMSTEVGR